MKAINLRCVNCRQEYALGLHYRCQVCDFPLEVMYTKLLPGDAIDVPGKPGLWRYEPFLPDVSDGNRISLGEGNTPLIQAGRLGHQLGLSNLFIKNEGQNPTGSFKDRPTAVGISMSLSLGVDTVVISSTGNAGASLAAYASKAGLHAIIIVTDRTPPAKLIQMAVHGAKIIPIKGSLSDAFWLAYQSALTWKWLDLTSTFLSPYPTEGNKTVAYELYRQLGKVPDWIIIPVSVGPLLVGIYKGFQELLALNLIDRLPRMVAAQASNCAPIVRAFLSGESEVRSWEGPMETVAGGIADPLRGYEKDGTYTLRILIQSRGMATASSDGDIMQAARQLAKVEGIFCEPTGAVSVAALNRLKTHPDFSPDHTIVCLLTGHGLKQVRAFESDITLPPAIEPTLEALNHLIDD